MEQKITIPEGFTLIQSSESEYKIVKKKIELPKNWDEFCETHSIKKGEAWIDYTSEIVCGEGSDTGGRDNELDRNILPNKEYAEAILALCQLIQLRDCYRQGWKPDWKQHEFKYCIEFSVNEIKQRLHAVEQKILSFQSEEIRDKFYNNFKDLIEKTKPLFI